MTKTIATALIAAAGFATAASAMVDTNASFERQLGLYAPNVAVEQLSTAQINHLTSVLTSGDSEGEKRASVRSIVQ